MSDGWQLIRPDHKCWLQMAEIGFGPDQAWVKAAWVVERLLADMLIASPNEPRIREVLSEAIAVNSLNFDYIEEPASSLLEQVLGQVIAGTLQESKGLGLTWKQDLDETARTQYRRALRELGDLMRHQ